MPLEYALQFRNHFPQANPYKNIPAQQHFESDNLGIGTLSHQVVRRFRQTPFVFNVMVAGETGLGKSTFVNTLFYSDLMERKQHRINGKTIQITPRKFELDENGVLLSLTVIDTPGFGDGLNRESDLLPIIDYIDSQYEAYYRAETTGGFRTRRADNRVHALLYFIAPNGHGMKELDLNFLKALSTKTNVIPVIAKADTMSAEERSMFKARVLADLQKYDIKVYPSSYTEDREAAQGAEAYAPFTVIGSDRSFDVGGKRIRGRMYRWGLAEVENPAHCDFIHLRSLLIKTNLHDLVETSAIVHYHNYRMSKLYKPGRHESILKSDDQYESQVDMKRKNFYEEMSKRENEMRQKIYQKIKEKEQSLREAEEALARKEQTIFAELDEQRRQLESEEKEVDLALERTAHGSSKKTKGQQGR